MAKFIVTSGTNYQPFSYQDIAAPVAQAAELHRQTQDAYDAIGMETAALQSYIENEEKNSIARKMYDNYQNQLSTLQENLWANGYNAQTRRDLYNAKNGFSSNILRLQQAVKDRQERSIEYHKMKLEHPDMVMGEDPGLASLDKYITNDRYGWDYYSYSGNALAKETGEDAQARMKELISNPNIGSIIPGYYTFAQRKGATSEEVANAQSAIYAKYGYANVNGNFVKVSDGDLTAYQNLSPVEKILADVMDSHVISSGAQGAVSDSEFGRLLTYSGSGLSQALGETTFQHEKDWMAENEQNFDIWRRQQGYNPTAGTGSGILPGIDNITFDNDTDTYTTVGPGYAHANKVLDRNIKQLDKMLTTRDGDEIRTNLDASALVFSEKERLDRMSKYGFDIGLTPPKTKDNYLHGTINDPNTGQTLEVIYDPTELFNGESGAIKTKPLGSRGNYQVDESLTNEYRQDRATYDAMIEYYHRNYPEIYKAANIDPDERAKMYKNTSETEIPLTVPLSEYKSYTLGLPENVSVEGTHNTYVSRAGSDEAEYGEKFGKYLSGGVNWEKAKGDGDDKLLKNESGKAHAGKSTGIHRWDYRTGRLSPEPIVKYDSVFKFDRKKDNSITNIRDVIISDDSLNNRYIVFQLTDGSYVGVGADMFKSDRIKDAFDAALYNLSIINNSTKLTDEQKAVYRKWNQDQLATGLRDIMGYDNATQDLGATKDIRG